MIPTDLSPLWNHLWQSTLCAPAVWLLTLAVRKNRAAVRYWLWFAASLKFLVPFPFLISAAGQLQWRTTPVNAPPPIAFAVERVSQPFALPLSTSAPAQSNSIPAILLVLWLTGVVIGIGFWLRWWQSIGPPGTPHGLYRWTCRSQSCPHPAAWSPESSAYSSPSSYCRRESPAASARSNWKP